MQRIAVVDYGMGNLRSVAKALEHVAGGEAEVIVTEDAAVIGSADKVVFPGQGAIRDCMAELDRLRLAEPIKAAIGDKPFLGICMGLQALMDRSEEHAHTRGLGVLPGRVRRFSDHARHPQTGHRLKVPHMGWNRVTQTGPHPLWQGVPDRAHFYFVHSYYVESDDPALVTGSTPYGLDFTSAVAAPQLFAVQFHPEKSQRAGLKLLENFIAWDGGD